MVERYAHVDDVELARAVRITHEHTDAATQGNGITIEKTGTAAGSNGPDGGDS
jgi:hypothetical protein